ncbi:MAG: hypothetical protein IAC77_00550 [Proteobacteria bacterium]|uniref:Uncharacterized protein n=1 Tax=Candidatus Enterousia excrementavium TaxID=2840789 RepID=A0A940IBE4_9PROT|nr:hypothetical protein [Candidatus Enterousia excrementavium]
MARKLLKICAVVGVTVCAWSSGACAIDLTGYRECKDSESRGICGAVAFSGENGFECYIQDGVDDMCICNSDEMSFVHGHGCFCADGEYNDPYSDDPYACHTCPSRYPLSDGANHLEQYGNYGNSNGMEDSCYRIYTENVNNASCRYQEWAYGGGGDVLECNCNPGYWSEDFSVYDPVCEPVGTGYYSTGKSGRSRCPTYTGPNGTQVVGYTIGYGPGADDITDCMIPESTVFHDATGSYVYSGGCYYSGE